MAINSNPWEAEAGLPQVWGQTKLHREFQSSQNYVARP